MGKAFLISTLFLLGCAGTQTRDTSADSYQNIVSGFKKEADACKSAENNIEPIRLKDHLSPQEKERIEDYLTSKTIKTKKHKELMDYYISYDPKSWKHVSYSPLEENTPCFSITYFSVAMDFLKEQWAFTPEKRTAITKEIYSKIKDNISNTGSPFVLNTQAVLLRKLISTNSLKADSPTLIALSQAILQSENQFILFRDTVRSRTTTPVFEFRHFYQSTKALSAHFAHLLSSTTI